MEFNPFIGRNKDKKIDYNNLINKPMINGVVLEGNQSSSDINIIDSKTTAEWNSQPGLISEKNKIYVYTDYDEVDGQKIPAMKIGNGNAYLIDLPFTAMGSGNVTPEQIEFWNNKARVYIDSQDEQMAVFDIH